MEQTERKQTIDILTLENTPMTMGFDAVEAAIKKANESSGGGNFLSNIYWKDGDRKVVRFLPAVNPDGTINKSGVVHVRDFYEFVNINDGKSKRDFIKPLEGPDYVAENIQMQYKNGPGKIKARSMGVGLVVLREEVEGVGPDGQRTWTYRDAEKEIEREGKAMRVKQYGVIKQTNKLFWAHMVDLNMRFGSICDRDFIITRRGGGLDTVYSMIPANPVPELDTEAKVAAAYSPPMTLQEWVDDLASQERAKALLGYSEETGMAAPSLQAAYGVTLPGQPTQQAAAPQQARQGGYQAPAQPYRQGPAQQPQYQQQAQPQAPSPQETAEYGSLREELMGR